MDRFTFTSVGMERDSTGAWVRLNEVGHDEQLQRIESDLAEIKALLTKKKRVVKPKVGTDYPKWFEQVWKAYPKRANTNPKSKAYTACMARLKERGCNQAALYSGAVRYALYCDATDKTGTEFVLQAATFYGPDKHFHGQFKIPKPKSEKPEVFSQAHESVDVNKIGRGDDDLDTSTNHYGEMT